MNIHITFYKYILNAIGRYNTQQNYISIESLLTLIAIFFVEKARFLSRKISNSEFRTRVYKGKMEAKPMNILFYTFLSISLRKINILKKTKLGPRELNEIDNINVKKILLNLTNISKSIIKEPKT